MPSWPWSRRKAKYVDGSSPHRFEPRNDDGLSSMASHGGGRMGVGANVSEALLASNLQRDRAHCGVPGCGRERSDPMHDASKR